MDERSKKLPAEKVNVDERSLVVIVPSAILALVTELSARSLVPIVPSLILEEVTESAASASSVTWPALILDEITLFAGKVIAETFSFENEADPADIEEDSIFPPISALPPIKISPLSFKVST